MIALQISIHGLSLERPLLQRDEKQLIQPLHKISSFGDLIHYWSSPDSPDLQPIRDLSYLLDIKLGLPFLLQNIILWCAGILLLRSFLYSPLSLRAAAFCFVWSVHPIFVTSVAWIASRKHLLALFFILLATRTSLKTRRGFWAPLFFALSLLSQPIFIMWPLWYALRFGKDRRYSLAAAISVSAICLFLNHQKYLLFYQTFQWEEKLQSLALTSFRAWDQIILGWGRVWIQVFYPFRIATDYSPYSYINIFGVFLGVFLSWDWLKSRKLRHWWLFFMLPLIFVLLKIQDVFWQDTYLLAGSAGLAVYAYTRIKDKKIFYPMLSIIFFLFLLLSQSTAKLWESDLKLWEHSFRTEPTCVSAINYAVEALRAKQPSLTQGPADYYFSQKCDVGSFSSSFFYLMVYWDERLSNSKKREILSQIQHENPLRLLILSLLLAQSKDLVAATHQLEQTLRLVPHPQQVFDPLELAPVHDHLSQQPEKDKFSTLLVEKVLEPPAK